MGVPPMLRRILARLFGRLERWLTTDWSDGLDDDVGRDLRSDGGVSPDRHPDDRQYRPRARINRGECRPHHDAEREQRDRLVTVLARVDVLLDRRGVVFRSRDDATESIRARDRDVVDLGADHEIDRQLQRYQGGAP